MEFSKPEYWSGWPFPSPGDLPSPGVELRIFPSQGSNPGLLHCKWILYQLSYKGRPRILKWVVYLFSSRCSRPRNWTGVSCIAGGFFTNRAIREAPSNQSQHHSICLTGKISQQNGSVLRYPRPVFMTGFPKPDSVPGMGQYEGWKPVFEANLSMWETAVICLFI